MKALIFGLMIAVGMSSTMAMAKTTKRSAPQRLCDWFQAKEDTECAHIMCDDDIAAGTFKDLDQCTSASDYAEGAQAACEGQENTVENLEKAYNQKHGTHIECQP